MQKKATRPLKAIIGIGNDDSAYRNTYHNVGFLAIDAITTQYSITCASHAKKHFCSCKTPSGLIVAKTQGLYMNESGMGVQALCAYYKLLPSDIMVIHDDADMTIGSYKIVFDQRSAGHKGIQSIIDQCGTQEFYRAKIGIRPAEEIVRKKAIDFVLKPITSFDLQTLAQVYDSIINTLSQK